MKKTFVIFDTEYTTWEGAMARGWSGENEYRELVQIAAIKIDQETMQEIDHLDLLIQPQFNPTLSDFFTQLTGITNEQVEEKGISCAQAMKIFFDFCRDQNTYSYGNDAVILGENIGYYKITDYAIGLSYLNNWAYYFHAADPETEKINSGKLATYFKVANHIKGDEHNALYDCRSQLEAFKYLYQKGHKFFF